MKFVRICKVADPSILFYVAMGCSVNIFHVMFAHRENMPVY